MVPHIAKRGYSFKGSGLYYLHDKGAMTSERVAWTQTRNLHTDDPEKALKAMAWTDKNSGYLKQRSGGSPAGTKQTEGNVYNNSLSWSPEEKPSKEEMLKAADSYIAHMGLSEHEAVIVAHNDTAHPHIHIISNLVHPETGKVKDMGRDWPRAQAWASAYERANGKIYCSVREENARKRAQGQLTKYRQQKQDYSKAVTRAFVSSENGKAFVQALKQEGLTLCAARRGAGYVLVDEKGDIQKLARQLDIEERGKAKTAAINAKLSDLDRTKLPDADKLAARCKEQIQKETRQREAEKVRTMPSMQQAYKQAAGQKERVSKAHTKAARQKSANDNRLSPEEAQQRRGEQRLHHLDQTRALESRQDEEKEEYWQELRAHYGPDDRKARLELEEIRLRQRQTGLRGWVYRFGSKAEEDKARAVEINKGLKDSKIKQAFHMQDMERQQEDERAALARKQGDERYRLEWELRKAMRPERTVQREEQQREQAHTKERTHQTQEPSKGRGRERTR